MKKIFLILFVFSVVFLSSAFAASGTNFSADQNVNGGGGQGISSTSYATGNSAGGTAVGSMSSSSYILINGFQGIVAASVTSGAVSTSSVTIESVEFDGNSVYDNETIQPDSVITATVTSVASSISTEASRILINGTATTFSNLTSPASFTAATGAFTYTLNLSDGTHYITIEAYDLNLNSVSFQKTLIVDTGTLTATQVYIFPNPYNPNTGTGKIAYRLNKDGDTSIYIFNAIGQLVYKRSYASGIEGAHAGYNELDFNAVSDFGTVLANDLYFLRIVSGGKPIGRAKIAILK